MTYNPNFANLTFYSSAWPTLAAADAAATAAGAQLAIDKNWAVASNTTLSSTLLTSGGVLTVATGVTLTCNGPVFGFSQVFAWAGTGSILLNGDCVTETSWFGTPQDGKIYVAGGSASSSSTSVTITGATYSSSDIGKSLVLAGAGTGGVPHKTTITGGSGTTFNIADATITAVSNVNVNYGTDNLAAFTMAFASRANQNGPEFHTTPCSSTTGTQTIGGKSYPFWVGTYHMSDILSAMGYTQQTWHADGAIFDNAVAFVFADLVVRGLKIFGSPQNGLEWNRTGFKATFQDLTADYCYWHGFAPCMTGLTPRTSAQCGSGVFIRCSSNQCFKDAWHIDASGGTTFYNDNRHYGCSGRGAGAYGFYAKSVSYGFWDRFYSESCGQITAVAYTVKFDTGCALMAWNGFVQDNTGTGSPSGAIDVSGATYAVLGDSNVVGAINTGSCILNFWGRSAAGATAATNRQMNIPDITVTDRMTVTESAGCILGSTFAGAASSMVQIAASSTSAAFGTYVPSTATRTHVYFENTNGTVGSITTNGTATAYVTSSDYRRKENETPLDGKTAIMGLKPYEFTWKADRQRDSGMFAHELQQYIPNAVVGQKDAIEDIGVLKNADGLVTHDSISEPLPEEMLEGQTWEKTGSRPVYQQVDYSKIVPYLVAHCQDLERRLAAFEGKAA